MTDSALTQQQLDFARYYVGNGGNGYQAALKAGYAEVSARMQASRLLAKASIQAEIERLKASVNRAVQALTVTIDQPPAGAEVIPPREQDGITKALVATLTRDYIRTNLMDIVEIGLGKRPTEITKIIKESKRLEDGTLKETLTAIKVESHERDLAAAVRALELLEKEVTKDDIATGAVPKDVTPDAARRERLAQMLAGIRMVMPSFATNGHGASNGNGAGH